MKTLLEPKFQIHFDKSISRFFDHKNVLITGASGFLASGILKILATTKANVHCLTRDLMKSFSIPWASSSINWYEYSAFSPEDWAELLGKTDVVFHLAAQTSAQTADESPLDDYEANVLFTLKLLEGFKSVQKRPIFVFASTASIFGIPENLPVNENAKDQPHSYYCLHKKIAESYVTSFSDKGWLRGTSLRLCNVYGPGKPSSKNDRGVLNQMIQKACREEPIVLYGNGKFIRDYLYIEDAALAFLKAAMSMPKILGQTFVIGSGQGTSIRQAARIIQTTAKNHFGREIEIQEIEHASEELSRRNFIANFQLFSSLTSWQPQVSLEKGIFQTFCDQL